MEMNPQEALECIRALARNILHDPSRDYRANELASLIDQLDDWIMSGGAQPLDWHVASFIKQRKG